MIHYSFNAVVSAIDVMIHYPFNAVVVVIDVMNTNPLNKRAGVMDVMLYVYPFNNVGAVVAGIKNPPICGRFDRPFCCCSRPSIGVV